MKMKSMVNRSISSLALVTMLALLLATVSTFAGNYEKEITAFERQDATNPPPKNAVLFVGSSTIRFWTTVSSDFPEYKTITRGFGGSQTSDLNDYLDRIVIPYAPSKIIIYEGDNDIAAGKSAETVAAEFKKVVERTRAALPNVEIYYLAIKPSPSRARFQATDEKANQLIKSYAETQPKLFFIDVATPVLQPNGKPDPKFFKPDMLHMNRSGYEAWIPIIKKAIHQNSTAP